MVRRGWKSFDVPTGWVQIVRGPRPKSEKWPQVGQQFGQPTQQSQPQPAVVRPLQSQVKMSGMRPFQNPCQGGGGKGTCVEVGDISGRDGWNGGTRGGVGASRPQTSTRGRERSSRRRPNQRVRIILDESPRSFGRVGHETSHCQPEHRKVGAEAELKALAQVAPAPQDNAAEV